MSTKQDLAWTEIEPEAEASRLVFAAIRLEFESLESQLANIDAQVAARLAEVREQVAALREQGVPLMEQKHALRRKLWELLRPADPLEFALRLWNGDGERWCESVESHRMYNGDWQVWREDGLVHIQNDHEGTTRTWTYKDEEQALTMLSPICMPYAPFSDPEYDHFYASLPRVDRVWPVV